MNWIGIRTVLDDIVSNDKTMERIRNERGMYQRRKVHQYVIARCRELRIKLTEEEQTKVWLKVMEEV